MAEVLHGNTSGNQLNVGASKDEIYITDGNWRHGGDGLVAFNTGNVISAQSTELLSSAFVLSDGSAYRYNHAAKTWQTV